MKKLIQILTVAGLCAVSTPAQASEYESAWRETEQCYAQYKQALLGLPNVNTAPLSALIASYDEHANETHCTITFAVTEGQLEAMGYFTIIDYRNDLFRRKERYRAIVDMFTSWSASAKAKRPDFATVLQERIDAKSEPYDLHKARMEWLRRNEKKSGTSK